ncbi:ABC transporter permease [Pseudogracilibacillus auburnensis]|uniref:Peptide/nickel transport system permease protein n=1 Tax=Pseudogracilibacillus auburnensis TaxID=1494959 RepID=A0A2V3VRI0_9BACI|nr:ABC transporter permease [Pseudogracilibacillus auburnensis]MBO1002523.1 ABC transporter permease [Pseudogracilibacillus auburnensis]PXW82635.1 peptide/nickel transport system permease protein [Pseudogracilibacillus auburnensis]
MASYIIRRLIMTIPLLLGITVLAFFIMQIAPGDPTSLLIDPRIRTEDLQPYIQKYGLDQPIHVQYIKWLGNMLQGDFGNSLIRQGVPVSELIMARLPNTLILMVVSTILAMIISVPFGILSASKQYSKTDYAITFTSFLGLATPNFWLGIVLIMFFSVQLGWFPTGGVATLEAPFSILDRIHHIILPAFVLATADMAGLTRYTRSSMLDVLKEDYIRTARAKGFKETRVIFRHGVRNGLIPIITIFGLMLPSFIGGSVIIESIFAWPGIGSLFMDAAFQRDYPVIMAVTVIAATLVVVGNLIADILYAIFDPRIEY